MAHPGPCSEPCAGMSSLGHFQAWGAPATNYGELMIMMMMMMMIMMRGARDQLR